MTTIKEELNAYIKWCKSQGTGLESNQYSVFDFYMTYVYPYNKGE